MRSPKGEFTIFDVANVAEGGETFPTAIDNSGVIVGYAYNPHIRVNHSFIRTPDGKVTTVDYPEATPVGGTVLLAINNFGVAAGYFYDSKGNHQGFSRKDGSFTPVNDNQPGSTEARSINDSGAVAAVFYPPFPKDEAAFSAHKTAISLISSVRRGKLRTPTSSTMERLKEAALEWASLIQPTSAHLTARSAPTNLPLKTRPSPKSM